MENNEEKININTEPITDAYALASSIIKIHNEESKNLDLLKLLKLSYICFGFITVEENQYLFDNRIEAWELGPVIPDIYYYLRRNYMFQEGFKLKPNINLEKININNFIKDEKIYSSIKEISEHYFEKKSSQMVRLTHDTGTPWKCCYDGIPSRKIPKKIIVSYYKELIKEYGNS